MLYLTHPACLEHDPSARLPGHPDVPARLAAIERSLAARDWLGCERREAPAASEERLALIHSESQIRAVAELAAAGGGAIDPDTHVGAGSPRAALHAVGGACEMARALLAGEHRAGFCAVRPPGHHAEPERSMGFCLFNGVAIAAELAVRELGAERVLVVDWDVHHGNGTVEAFRRAAPTSSSPGCTRKGSTPAAAPPATSAPGPARGTRSTCRCQPARGRTSGWLCSSGSSSRWPSRSRRG